MKRAVGCLLCLALFLSLGVVHADQQQEVGLIVSIDEDGSIFCDSYYQVPLRVIVTDDTRLDVQEAPEPGMFIEINFKTIQRETSLITVTADIIRDCMVESYVQDVDEATDRILIDATWFHSVWVSLPTGAATQDLLGKLVRFRPILIEGADFRSEIQAEGISLCEAIYGSIVSMDEERLRIKTQEGQDIVALLTDSTRFPISVSEGDAVTVYYIDIDMDVDPMEVVALTVWITNG